MSHSKIKLLLIFIKQIYIHIYINRPTSKFLLEEREYLKGEGTSIYNYILIK